LRVISMKVISVRCAKCGHEQSARESNSLFHKVQSDKFRRCSVCGHKMRVKFK
jgi:DNA-directed RNA polymerase subunit RPC12/RpoP